MNIKTCKHCNISFYRHGAGSCIPNDSCAWCHLRLKDADNENDPVNSPEHYQGEDGIECIDAIRAALGLEGFIAHCRATAIKYCWRAGRKGEAAEDLRKAEWYLARAAEDLEKLHKPITRELYTEAAEERMGVAGQNGGAAEHCPSDEWIPNNGEEPDLPDGTRVDIKFADGIVFSGRSARNWVWAQNGSSVDITHYRIHRPE